MNINLIKLIQNIKTNIQNIESLNIPQSKKTYLYKKYAINYKKYLRNKNISIFTYSKYISLARKQFIEIKHHNFNKKIKYLIKNFKYFNKELKNIRKHTTKKIFIKIQKLKYKLNQIDNIIYYLNNIYLFKSKNNNNIFKYIFNNFPKWKYELNILKNKKWFYSHKFLINKFTEGKILLKKFNKLKINHEILFYLKIEKKIFNLLKTKSLKSLKNKKNNTILINYKSFMQKIYYILLTNNDMNNYKDISLLSFALSCISGRRMIEIIKTGIFKKINKNEIYFTGQAKNIKKKYKIYILFNTKLFIQKIKQLRSSNILKKIIIKTKYKLNIYKSKNILISNYLSSKFNKWVKIFFNNNKRTYKDSRSIYTRIVFKKWFNKDYKWLNIDEDTFITKILGHNNIYSQIHYKQFKLNNFCHKWKPKKFTNFRLKNLISLNNKIHNIIKKKTSYKIHNITKNIIKKTPNKIITTYLLRKYKFNNQFITKYINFICPYINQKKINNKYIILYNN